MPQDEIKLTQAKAIGVSDDLLQLVSFSIGEEEFGVDITIIKEINRMVDVTRVPNTPIFVVGVINLRGKVVPIIDLRKRLGMPPREHTKDTRIIVVELETRTIGFIVDQVNEVIRINKNITEKPPQMVGSIDAEYITAIGKLEDRLLILLDLERIVTKRQLEELAETEA